MDHTEIWKDIQGYSGLYQVSDYGRIKRLHRDKRHRCGSFRILKQKIDPNGYHCIGLYKNKKRKDFLVHKLVLKTFIGQCPPKMESCHNDGNPGNNFIENLRYDTHSNNMLDKTKHGRATNPIWFIGNYGNKSPVSKLNEKQVIKIKELLGSTLKNKHNPASTLEEIAKQYGVSISTISNIKNNKTWKHTNAQ